MQRLGAGCGSSRSAVLSESARRCRSGGTGTRPRERPTSCPRLRGHVVEHEALHAAGASASDRRGTLHDRRMEGRSTPRTRLRCAKPSCSASGAALPDRRPVALISLIRLLAGTALGTPPSVRPSACSKQYGSDSVPAVVQSENAERSLTPRRGSLGDAHFFSMWALRHAPSSESHRRSPGSPPLCARPS
jgi:hypothetical protein